MSTAVRFARLLRISGGAVLLFALAPSAEASTIQCCSLSSDLTPASSLSSTFDFQVAGTTLTLTVDNDTVAPNEFNINEIFFNVGSNVSALTFTSATHSDPTAGPGNDGDVTVAWGPIETNTMVDGFGIFDFGLTDGVGMTNDQVIGPGEDIVYVFSISGTGPFAMSDFGVPNASGNLLAAKFVNGPDDPEDPGNEDSAFGAVPEPGTLLLIGAGLAAILSVRRRA